MPFLEWVIKNQAKRIARDVPYHLLKQVSAHAERNAASAAYNFAEHLPERRTMMQAWADYLDRLKFGAEVISLHAGVAR